MSIKPIGNYVLVERIDQENKTSGGIIIPETSKERSTIGKVIATGDGITLSCGKTIPSCVKAGDVIAFTKWNWYDVENNNEKLILIKEQDILGIMEE